MLTEPCDSFSLAKLREKKEFTKPKHTQYKEKPSAFESGYLKKLKFCCARVN